MSDASANEMFNTVDDGHEPKGPVQPLEGCLPHLPEQRPKIEQEKLPMNIRPVNRSVS
jgi:hypothetical protein